MIMYGANWCPDCRKSKAYLTDNKISFQYVEIAKENEWAIPIIKELNNGKRKIPAILINHDIVLVEPVNEELRQALNTCSHLKKFSPITNKAPRYHNTTTSHKNIENCSL